MSFPQKPARRYTNPRMGARAAMQEHPKDCEACAHGQCDGGQERLEEEVAAPEGTATLPEQLKLATTDSTAFPTEVQVEAAAKAMHAAVCEQPVDFVVGLQCIDHRWHAQQARAALSSVAPVVEQLTDRAAAAEFAVSSFHDYERFSVRLLRQDLAAANAKVESYFLANEKLSAELASLREELAATKQENHEFHVACDLHQERLGEVAAAMGLSSLSPFVQIRKEAERLAGHRCKAAGSLPDNAEERLEEVIMQIRDCHPRRSDDAPSDEVAAAVYALVRSWLSPVVPAAAEPDCEAFESDLRRRLNRDTNLGTDGVTATYDVIYLVLDTMERHGYLPDSRHPSQIAAAVPVEPPAAEREFLMFKTGDRITWHRHGESRESGVVLAFDDKGWPEVDTDGSGEGGHWVNPNIVVAVDRSPAAPGVAPTGEPLCEVCEDVPASPLGRFCDGCCEKLNRVYKAAVSSAPAPPVVGEATPNQLQATPNLGVEGGVALPEPTEPWKPQIGDEVWTTGNPGMGRGRIEDIDMNEAYVYFSSERMTTWCQISDLRPAPSVSPTEEKPT